MQRRVNLLVFCLIFKFIKRVFSYFFLIFLISYSALISTVFCLKYSFGSWDINVIANLRISSYYKFLNTLWTFHSEFIDFCRMKVSNPCFDSVEPYSFCYHILTTLASNMERGFVSDFTTSNSFALNYLERFLMLKLTFFWWYICGIIIFRYAKVISSSCGKSTH